MTALAPKLRDIPSSDASDALDRIGVKGVLGRFLPVIENSSVVGSAFPVEVRKSGGATTSLQKGLLDAVRKAPRHSVLVLHSESIDYSCWGGVASWHAKKKGIAGVVVDGAARDLQEIRKVRLAVFVRSRSPASGYGRLAVASIGEPVQIDSLVIRMGDVVTADSDGVTVIPQGRIGDVIRKVWELQETEKKTRLRFGS